MDHLRIYNQIIERSLNRSTNGYTERHHIIPKCLGGGDDSSNVVRLTAREHFLCHWLLYRAYPQNRKLAVAFDRMAKGGSKKQQRYTPSSRVIAEAREASSRARVGIKRPSVSIKLKGRPVSIETKERRKKSRECNNIAERMSVRMSGRNNPMYGSKREDRALLNTKTKSKKCVIDGVLYDGVGIASRELGIPHKTLLNRIRSENFPNCVWFLEKI